MTPGMGRRGGAVGVVGGQNFSWKHGIDTGSDVSVGRSGRGLEA